MDAMISATHEQRLLAANSGDPSSRADRLGQYLLIDDPYPGSHAIYHGPFDDSESRHGTRAGRETSTMVQDHGFKAGYVRGWTSSQSWQTPDGWAVVLWVWELASVNDAVAFDEESLRNGCQQTRSTFTVPGVRGATGISLRHTGSPVAEEMSFVRGPRRYVVSLELAVHDGYDRPVELARREDVVAR